MWACHLIRYGLCAAEVVDLHVEGGKGYTLAELTEAVQTHKPAVLFLVQVCSLPAVLAR